MNPAGIHERPWMKRSGLFGAVDGGTAAVIAFWIALWLLLSSLPDAGEQQMVRPPSPDCMIVTWQEPLERLPLALRPDLVALPSPVSFGAYGSIMDTLYGAPSISHRQVFSGLPMESRINDDSNSGAFRKTVVMETAANTVGRLRFPDLHAPEIKDENPVLPIQQTVVYSEGLSGTRLKAEALEGLAWGDEARLPEVELTVAFDEKGIPESVFLEKSSGNAAVDSKLVRRFWDASNWLHPKGRGTVRIH